MSLIVTLNEEIKTHIHNAYLSSKQQTNTYQKNKNNYLTNNKTLKILRQHYLAESNSLKKKEIECLFNFVLEEIVTLSVWELDKSIEELLQDKKFEYKKKKISFVDVEKQIGVIDSSINKDIISFLKELNERYYNKWLIINNIVLENTQKKYLDYYRDYYDDTFDKLFKLKHETLSSISTYLKVEQKKPTQVFTQSNIISDIKKVTNNLNLNFFTDQIIINKGQYSMYIKDLGGEIHLNLNEPRSFNDVHKIWHEFGHAIHYQNMNKDLSFSFTKLYNLTVMESVAILFQIICNKLYCLDPLYNIFNLTWWSFVQYFSQYEWLENDFRVDYDLINKTNLKLLFDNIPIIPFPLRYLSRGFKSFRYSCAAIVAMGMNSMFEETYGTEWIFSKKAGNNLRNLLEGGGIAEIDEFIKVGLSKLTAITY